LENKKFSKGFLPVIVVLVALRSMVVMVTFIQGR